jgi:ABC-type Fe3+-hydroxamate transport system substrate-binding protein
VQVRVVSLVPSLTEAVAATAPELLVGATDWCSHPADLAVDRVGGTKYPDLDRVLALRPDLVLANVEENRKEDVERLQAAGIRVHVCFPQTVDGALDDLAELLAAVGVADEPPWLLDARRAWAEVDAGLDGPAGPTGPAGGGRLRAVVPVWRRPWVVLGSDTFAGDVLRRLGVDHVYAGAAQRYPRPAADELQRLDVDLVVLPDEPYLFTAHDGPEAFPGTPCALVSGRHLTWYGPSLGQAPAVLRAALAAPVTARPVPGG